MYAFLIGEVEDTVNSVLHDEISIEIDKSCHLSYERLVKVRVDAISGIAVRDAIIERVSRPVLRVPGPRPRLGWPWPP